MYFFNKAKEKFLKIISENKLKNSEIKISMRPLSPSEVVGYPKRDDYPLLNGKEVMIEAIFNNSKGQAFTDEPSNFCGTISNIIDLQIKNSRERALFISSLNAIMRDMGLIDKSVHCKNFELEECAKNVSNFIYKKFGKISIALVGLQPGFASELIDKFGKDNLTILDLNPLNIGKDFKGVKILDSNLHCKKSIQKADLTLATGSTIINDTIDEIIYFSKKVIFFGVTIAGVSKLLNLERICLNAH